MVSKLEGIQMGSGRSVPGSRLVVLEARLSAQGDTDYFRIAYDGRGNLPRSLMPTAFRNLCQGFSFDAQSMLLAV
jgi:hypothetical protein